DIGIKALSPAINDPTTAVQTIDQLEDLLRRLGASELDAGYAADESGALRLVFPTPTWEDYLTLAFDEIRQFGSGSVQVMRRMRSALVGLAESLSSEERAQAARRYLEHLDHVIEASPFDVEDRRMARQEDRQGIGLSRRQSDISWAPARRLRRRSDGWSRPDERRSPQKLERRKLARLAARNRDA